MSKGLTHTITDRKNIHLTIKRIGLVLGSILILFAPNLTAEPQDEDSQQASAIEKPELETRYPFLANQISEAHFKPFGVGEMPNETITDIEEGPDGFIWVSSEAGLVRYDGDSFKPIPTQLSNNGNVLTTQYLLLNADPNGKIWLTTTDGFQIYDSRSESFSAAPNIETDLIADYFVDVLLFDDNGTWILFRNDSQTILGLINKHGALKQWPLQDNADRDHFYSFAGPDSEGNLWFWAELEQHILKFNDTDFTSISSELSLEGTVFENDPSAHYDQANQFAKIAWFGFIDGSIPLVQIGDTITLIDPDNGKIGQDALSVSHPDIEDAFIRDAAITADKRIWLATNESGLFELSADFSTVNQHLPSDNNPNGLPGYTVTSLLVDRFGMLWCGTYNGAFLVDPERNAIATFSKNNDLLGNSDALELLKLSNNDLWVGHSNGVDVINLESGKRETYSPSDENHYSPPEATALAKTTDGSIYLGSQFSKELYLFNNDKKGFEAVDGFEVPEFSGGIISLTSLDNNGLLVSTARGLMLGRNNEFIPIGEGVLGGASGVTKVGANLYLIARGSNGLFLLNSETIQYRDVTPPPLRDEFIIDIDSLGDGSVWVVSNIGVHHLNFGDDSLTVQSHVSQERMPSNQYASILVDHRRSVWVGSQGGVFRIQPNNKNSLQHDNSTFKVDHFGRDQGFHWSTYFVGAATRIDEDLIAMGSTGGAIIFSPEKFKLSTLEPQIYLTDLQRFNRSVEVGKNYGDRILLKKPLFRTAELELDHSDSVISFRFAAMHTRAPESNRLWYQMEGIDPDWNETSTGAVATYTLLPPGEYKFKVKAQSGDGVNVLVPHSIVVRVLPVWWQTWIFRLTMILSFLAGIFALFLWRTQLIRHRASILEFRVHDATANLENKNNELIIAREKAEAATEARGQFLANMSHEIRTPINGVIGMTSLLSNSPLNDEQHSYLDTVRSSGEALLGIINEILDFSKIEAGEIELDIQSFNLEKCIFDAVDTVTPLASTKDISLVVNFRANYLSALKTDEQRLRQSLLNLLSNAVKFTATGEVIVDIDIKQQESFGNGTPKNLLIVSVSDSGIGIAAEKLSHLFDPFTQADASTTRKYGGTGLGLSITKNLVEILGGELSVSSQLGVGSVFTITLAVDTSLATTSDWHPNIAASRIAVLIDNDIEQQTLHYALSDSIAEVDYYNSIDDLKSSLQTNDKDVLLVDESVCISMIPTGDSVLNVLNAIDKLPSVIYLASLKNQAAAAEMYPIVIRKPMCPSKILHAIASSVLPSTSINKPSYASKVTPLKQMNILVAEDNVVNQTVAKQIIKTLGSDVDIAANGIEALELIANKHYDIVFMDIQMPEMDGVEATTKLRASAATQPYIIAMTANVQNEDRERCLKAGMNDFIAKPIRIEDVRDVMSKAIKVIDSLSF